MPIVIIVFVDPSTIFFVVPERVLSASVSSQRTVIEIILLPAGLIAISVNVCRCAIAAARLIITADMTTIDFPVRTAVFVLCEGSTCQ